VVNAGGTGAPAGGDTRMRRQTKYPAELHAGACKTFNAEGPKGKHVEANLAFASPGTRARETVKRKSPAGPLL
jgi:hypothetical protein